MSIFVCVQGLVWVYNRFNIVSSLQSLARSRYRFRLSFSDRLNGRSIDWIRHSRNDPFSDLLTKRILDWLNFAMIDEMIDRMTCSQLLQISFWLSCLHSAWHESAADSFSTDANIVSQRLPSCKKPTNLLTSTRHHRVQVSTTHLVVCTHIHLSIWLKATLLVSYAHLVVCTHARHGLQFRSKFWVNKALLATRACKPQSWPRAT